MSRLPTVGGDGNAWGTVLNDYLTESASTAVLASSPSVGATTFDLAVVPSSFRVGSIIAIDAYTTECELRSVSNIAGNTLTVAALKFAHASNDAVDVIAGSDVPTEMYGLTGDGSNEWAPLQRLVRESVAFALTVRGKYGTPYYIQQPLLLNQSCRIDELRIRSRTGFSPVDASGAMVMLGSREFVVTSAVPASNTLVVAAGHALGAFDTDNDTPIVFYAAYGETLPAPLVAGRPYYIDTIPDSTSFTVSATVGGATFDITADGTGYAQHYIGGLSKGYWESMYLELTIVDLNGLIAGLQQPSWIRNLRINMEANATTQGSATGFLLGGQLAYLDNVEINTLTNCNGMEITGSGFAIRGFNCNGVNNNDTGIVVAGGGRHTISDIWTEQCGRAGVEIAATIKGLTFEGYWLQSSSSPTTAPVLLVSALGATYAMNCLVRSASDTQLIVSDTARSITIGGATEMDANLVFHGLRQQEGGVGPILNFQGWAFPSTTYTASRLTRWIKANPSGGSFVVTLPTAVGWLGAMHTVKNQHASNTVTVDPTGSETIDGAATVVLGPLQAVTVLSDGANWHKMDTELAGSPTTYTPTNVTPDRAYDADTVVVAELADVVGTLIADLQARKIIG